MPYKHKLILFSFTLVSILSYGCMQDKTISLVRSNFSIQYPSLFEIDESGEANTIFALKTKKKQDVASSFIENVNLAEDKSKYESFEEYFTNSEKNIEKYGKILKSEKRTLNGNNYLRLVFQLSQGNESYTFIQHFYAHKQKFYILTFSSDTREFDSYLKPINKMFNSFKLK